LHLLRLSSIIQAEKPLHKSKEGKTVTKQTIELNGKHYDAVTGVLISSGAKTKTETATPKTKLIAKTVKTDTLNAEKAATKVEPNHTKAHSVQTSQTLMRKSVKRPGPTVKRHSVHVPVTHESTTPIQIKHGAHAVNQHRLERAKNIQQSAYVQKYNPLHHIPVTLSSVPVQPEPKQEEQEAPEAPPPVQHSIEMFERAIENASHYVDIAMQKKHFTKKRRKHALSMGTGFVALMLVAGFMVYQNSPGLQVSAAGMRVGVSATAPNFKEIGLKYNGVATAEDKRIIGLKDDNGTYQLTQEKTNWSGESMIHSVSSTDASGKPNYVVIEVSGQKVYRLSNGSDMWVKDGVWYSLSGNRGVNPDKLEAIVQNS
jgi:hypothetical protein